MMFENKMTFGGQLAQLVRAFGSHPRGHWFESSIAQVKYFGDSRYRYYETTEYKRENYEIRLGKMYKKD